MSRRTSRSIVLSLLGGRERLLIPFSPLFGRQGEKRERHIRRKGGIRKEGYRLGQGREGGGTEPTGFGFPFQKEFSAAAKKEKKLSGDAEKERGETQKVFRARTKKSGFCPGFATRHESRRKSLTSFDDSLFRSSPKLLGILVFSFSLSLRRG